MLYKQHLMMMMMTMMRVKDLCEESDETGVGSFDAIDKNET
jgi:hypothetical protein